ncbi:STAS domain-containing protein [Streptomyces echinatus]|uniref:Anti-sigma factor antagonist n=1 Tax=Streptomyces echinatus TaxID=67293 RepID=A0A7W9PRH1_9ACTN|nr:STAS domain-containing protein [Streptomyces echinatus]MBB5926524.1 anti-anti-sigma factor [Streptomyces echinatus]
MNEAICVSVEHHGPERCEVTVAGELDVLTAMELRHVLQEAITTARVTVVDLSRLQFCDCTGLSALLAAHRVAKERGTALRLRAVPYPLARLLRLTRTGSVFAIDAAPAPAALHRTA